MLVAASTFPKCTPRLISGARQALQNLITRPPVMKHCYVICTATTITYSEFQRQISLDLLCISEHAPSLPNNSCWDFLTSRPCTPFEGRCYL